MKNYKTIEELEQHFFNKAGKIDCSYELKKILYDAIYDAYWLGESVGTRAERKKHKTDQADITMED